MVNPSLELSGFAGGILNRIIGFFVKPKLLTTFQTRDTKLQVEGNRLTMDFDADFTLRIKNEGRGALPGNLGTLHLFTPVDANLVHGRETMKRVIGKFHYHEIVIERPIGANQSIELPTRFLLRFARPNTAVFEIFYYIQTPYGNFPKIKEIDGQEMPRDLGRLEIQLKNYVPTS